MKAVFARGPGGADQLEYADVPVPAPGPGQVLVRLHAIGVNFIDIYFRTGLYTSESPILLGQEGAGTVEAIGEGVTRVEPGDRVAYAMHRGSYAEYALAPAGALVKLPEEVDFQQAAAVMLQGMTAHYLTHSTFPLKKGDTALIHAAAGGVGLLLVQMTKRLGARAIGTVSTEEKAQLAREAGCDDVILYTEQEFQPVVMDLTAGRGVDVVYDSVGKATFGGSIDSLRPRGMLVTYGNASGPVDPVSPLLLSQKGSLFLTRPVLSHYTSTREDLLWRAGDVLKWVGDGSLKLRIEHTYPLSEAARAHEDLESRKTTGKLLLIP